MVKVMFLHVCVILFTGGGLRAGRTPPGQEEPPWAGRTPPGPGRPPSRENPPDQADPPPDQADTTPPPHEADSRIQSTSGRYASYWNAFLFLGISIVKTGFMGRGSSTQFGRYPLKKKFTPLPPRENYFYDYMCGKKCFARIY